MMRVFFSTFLALVISVAADAQSRSVYSPPDPFLLTEFMPGGTLVPGNSNPNGATPRAPIDTSETNIVIILAGQSLAANTSGVLNIPTNTARINNVNLYDGASYAITANMLGCSNSTIGPGNIAAYIGDDIVNAHPTYRVWIETIAIGGTLVADWATGNLGNPPRVAAAMKRLASRGLTQASPNTFVYFLWMQGESDNDAGTSSASYQASFATVVAQLNAAGFAGKILVNLETLSNNVTSATIRAAQAAVVNGTTIFQGGDIDTLTGGTNRNVDGTHLTSTGAGNAATLMLNAMHATGAPL